MVLGHVSREGVACDAGSWIWFGELQWGWRLECEDPLTVSPSLLCTRCGRHGFIRQGRWEEA